MQADVNWFNVWGKYAASAIAIATVLGFFAKPIYKKISEKIKKKKEARKKLQDDMMDELKNINLRLDSMNKRFNDMDSRLDRIIGDVTELQGDSLCRAYTELMKQGWCSQLRKRQICDWYKKYTANGGNHQIKSYEEDILSLPEFPPEV